MSGTSPDPSCVGLLDIFRPSRLATTVATAELTGVAAPWLDPAAALTRVTVDLMDASERAKLPVTAQEALSVPGISKGRAVILGDLAPRPLRHLTADGTELDPPTWVHQTGVLGISPTHRMASTLEDMILHGDALWIVQRDGAGDISAAMHLPHTMWRIEQRGAARVIQIVQSIEAGTWRDANASECIYFMGPQAGLLTLAAATIRGALDVEAAWQGRARTPAPVIIIEEQDARDALTDEEVKEAVASAAAARLNPNGAVMFQPAGLNIRIEQGGTGDVLTAARNAVRLDIAAFLNLPAAALDSTLDKSSLNYETTEGARSELRERLAYWASAIEDRLSMDDVSAEGVRVRFDLTAPALATGTPTED